MTLSWRLLRLRSRLGPYTRAPVQYFSHSELQSQPNLDSVRSLTSLFHARSLHSNPSHSRPIFSSHFSISINPRTPIFHRFSSQPEIEISDSDLSAVSEIFSEPRDSEEIRKRLDANSIVIGYEWVLLVLGKLESSPDVATRFFNWLSENEEARFLSSKSYNLMLRNLGVNGLVDEFWGLFEVMNKKGYGVMKFVRDRALERFIKDKSIGDVKKLKRLYEKGSTDKSDEKIALRARRIIEKEVWSDDVEKKLRDLNPNFSSDMVSTVLESLPPNDPTKALIFFRWLEESNDTFKHDLKTYNAMAKILGREDSVDRFWKVVDEMKGLGFEIFSDTFELVFVRFIKKKMVRGAVKLYELAAAGPNNKPSRDCGVFLLKKVSMAGPKFDAGLFSETVRAFAASGNIPTDSTLEAVLKSLRSVGRIGESRKALKAMEGCGYSASDTMRNKIVSLLCIVKRKNEAIKLVKSAGLDPNLWRSLIRGLSAIGDVRRASDNLRKMVETHGAESAGSALGPVVAAYCRRNNAALAYKLLEDLVVSKQVKPWPETYRALIVALLAQKGFDGAVKVLGLMKGDGLPPFVDPFVGYLSKSGTRDEAAVFFGAVSKTVASSNLYLRVFEAYFEAERRSEAQDFLSECPAVVRNHPDILNLFASKVVQISPLAA